MAPSHGFKTRVALAATLLCCLASGGAHAQESAPGEPPLQRAPGLDLAREAIQDALERIWVPQSRLTDGLPVRRVFQPVVASIRPSVVRVRCNDRTVALGGIVGPDGWVLTKATQLDGPVRVRLQDRREYDASVVGIDRQYDLAMLKLDAEDLPAMQLESDATAAAGDWVATVGTSANPVAVGVLSVAPRAIPHRAGKLGVQLEEAVDGAMVAKIVTDSAAEEAGLLVNDIVYSVNGEPTRNRRQFIRAVQKFSPGDTITIGVRRDRQELSIDATLISEFKELRRSRSDYQNSLGSELSSRRFGFPLALTHDTVLSTKQCGGPLVNLDGQVIGFNIARAGRTESYAIPTAKLKELMSDLMSGRLTPK